MKPKTRIIIKMLGVLWMFAIFILLMQVFLKAYNHPEKYEIVYIDKFNEAGTEMIILPFVLIINSIATYLILKDCKKEYIENET